MKFRSLAMTVSSMIFADVCANASADPQATVDCSTASDDIAHLQHEKKSTHERKMKGILAIMPIGIVVNAAAAATEKTDPNKEMQIDEYNKKIDEHMAEIKTHCKVDQPESPALQSN